MIDALAWERQFIDHMAPVWTILPDRGRFLVDPSLVDHAASLGIEAVPTPRPKHDSRYPSPRHDGPPAFVASYGCTKEARRLGYGPFAFIEHGIGQSYGEPPARANGSYSGGRDRDDTELFLVPGPDPAAKWRAAYPGARVEVVGSPRLDDLPARIPDGMTTVAVSFHWPAPISISGYAGTAFGDFIGVLPALAERFHVIGHAHPKGDWPAQMERKYRRAGIEFVADFAEVCRRADVYVGDNSSTIYEFAATGRPVVLMNARHWTRRGPGLGLRFWNAAHVGINVDRPAALIPSVEEALADPPERQWDRADALSLVYGVRSGGAALAAAAITDWLATRRAIAA